MSFLDDAIGSIGQDLAKTAVDQLDQATGVNVGGTLAYLFGNEQASGGANMAELGPAVLAAFGQQQQTLSLLQAELYQQGEALAALGRQLTGIAMAISQITGMIKNIQQLLQKIGQEQLYQDWRLVDVQIAEYIDSIDTAFTTYGDYVSTFKTTPTNEVEQLVIEILSSNDGPKVGLGAIHDFIMSNGQARGVLQLWSAMVTPLVQQGQMDYRLAVKQYFQYYQSLAYAQLRATNLVMEGYNYNNDHANARKVWDRYTSYLLLQEDVFITWLVPLVYAGQQGGVFKFTNDNWIVNFTAYHSAMQFNPGVQYVRGDLETPGDAFYSPSQIFKDAEELLANLFVTGPKDRRIVVHMIYPDGFGINPLLDGLNLTLSPVGSTKTVSAVSANRLGGPYQFPRLPEDYNPFFPDQNIYNGAAGFYLKRYVFSDNDGGLKDAQYRLTNLNGHNGLVEKATYMTGEHGFPPTPFLQDNIVNYPLQVTAADKFDFMNFMAYATPILYPGL
jgi:hypothetical protein